MRILINIGLVLILLTGNAYAQEFTQTIRGTIVDKDSEMTLPGVTVVLSGSTPIIGTTTDMEGDFRLEDVAIGRVGIQISFMGYAPVVLDNLVLTSAKELILNVSLEEQVTKLNAVEIIALEDKRETINQMTTVSSRTFSIDETNRYAGSLGDPSRMAANFAGVSTANDSRNDIVIRGNSPTGLLWRLDGINIPNPNHFGSLGTTGGPVSILNNNLLDNSDFMTGAFPAEYGNATSGAFDLKMRTGNNEKREFIGQVGFNGFELAAEGPLLGKGSYLASYRYSTMGVMDALGIPMGVGSIPQYQDFSFKVDVPAGLKYGRFSLFGIGGNSYIELLDSEKEDDDFTLTDAATDTYYGSQMGVMGISHTYFFNEKTKGVLSFATSGVKNTIQVDSVSVSDGFSQLEYGNDSYETKYSATYNLNKKFNARNVINVGATADFQHFYYSDSVITQNNEYLKLTDFDGNAALLQSHIQWKHKFTDILTLNSGIHYQQFTLNGSEALEPRVGVKWNFAENQFINLGAGMHSQLLPMSTYLYETRNFDGTYSRTNESLEFTKSNHLVLGYDNNISRNFRIKFETYYQALNSVPVEAKS